MGTIQRLYDLFLEHRTIRKVKEQADQIGLRSRHRTRGAGRVTGGNPFDRGHIHHILTNPIYAGRIRHKDQVFDGQHPAIIDPEHWVKVQQIFEASAAKGRGTKRKAPRSPLAGKLFDETGDRLTPSHSVKKGKRLRHYISHRLVKDRSQTHPDAWRVPAEQLERMINEFFKQRLAQTGIATKLVPNASAVQIEAINEKLRSIQSRRTCSNLLE